MKINLIESQTVEFKQIWKDEYLKTICAFANSEGGSLYIGLDDNAVVLGIEDIENLKTHTFELDNSGIVVYLAH